MRLGSNRRMIIGSLACLVFLAGAFTPLSAGAEDTVRKTFTVRGGGKLALDSDLGSIEVRSHQKAEVRVEVTRKVRSLSRSRREKILKEFQLSFDQEGNTVTIEGDYNRKRFRSLFGRRWSLVDVAKASASRPARLADGESNSTRPSPTPGASGSGTNRRTS